MEWKGANFDWNQARAFLVTAEEGSLSAAARALGLTQPTLSRQVAGIEEALGVTLFERSSRTLLLTQAGTQLLEHFRTMGDAANRISIAATGQSQSFTGHVAISATNLLATQYLPAILAELQAVAPGLQVEIVTSNQISDLRRREADIAIRHARPQDDALFAKRLPDRTATLYASRSYLASVGHPSKPEDFTALQFVGFEHPEHLLGLMASRGLNLTRANFNLCTASGTMSVELMRQGLGIGVLPDEIAKFYDELVVAWDGFEPVEVETWLVAHRELRTNPSIRLVFDLLAKELSRKGLRRIGHSTLR
ncbi:LysR family transcriptional regulator [uncultured Tateyamaria sp.]|uniref:LysR family transcriptional regulator n=1 Tax=uncultured Tateyamaria sp. TaxID=455651 RepID=UPI0026207F1D|nr:LysR family transcriptional regulator [uncultured Tateyamaria sp.]